MKRASSKAFEGVRPISTFAFVHGLRSASMATRLAVSALGLAAGACSSDDDQATPSTSHTDAGRDAASSGGTDSGSDATRPDAGEIDEKDAGPSDSGNWPDVAISDAGDGAADAADAADATPPLFCATQAGLAFCADFDSPAGGDAGLAGWDQIVGGAAEVATSGTRSQSAPSSLRIALPAGPTNTDRSAKVVKTVTPAGKVTQAIYEFDVFVDKLPKPGAGGFLTDFQFSDALAGGGNGADTFGFRIAVFSDANGAFDHAELQHNAPSIPATPDDIINPFPLVGGKWNHVKMVVAFATASSVNTVGFQAYVDSATPAVDKIYPAPFAQAPFARVADGVVFAFDGTNKEYVLWFDNVTLKIQ
jgi:hypothetical protein